MVVDQLLMKVKMMKIIEMIMMEEMITDEILIEVQDEVDD
jgi:hypothetical protein